MYYPLAEVATRGDRLVGLGSALFVMVLYGFIIALVIIVLFRLARYLGNAGKEQQKMRLELSKLADEVHKLRQSMQTNAEKDRNSDKPTSQR